MLKTCMLTLVAILIIDSAGRITVLRSLLKLEDDGQGLSGAKLIPDNPTLDRRIRDISLCLRFNYKILGRWEQRSQLIHIEDWRSEPGVRREREHRDLKVEKIRLFLLLLFLFAIVDYE